MKGEIAMQKLDYEILKEYSHELNEINYKLEKMERGRIYELSGAQMDGYLATNAKQLKEMINDLLYKIQNGEEGMSKQIANFMKNII